MPSPCYLNPPGEPSFNEILITTVREYPALYSNQRRTFENVDRSKVWEEVAAKIGRGVTGEFAKKRWLQLRDRYRKELKISIAQNFSQPQKWSHFPLLNWLDPYLQGAIPITPNNSAPCYTLDNVSTTGNSDAFYENFAVKLSSAELSTGANEGTLSDCFDDLKPVMSTLQSVLAVAEATANLKKEAAAMAGKKRELSAALESKSLSKLNLEILQKIGIFSDGFETDGESDMNCSDISACNGKVSKESCGSPSPSSPQASVVSIQEDGNLRGSQLPRDCSTPSQETQQLRDGSSHLSILDGPNVASSPCTSEAGLETEEIVHVHTHAPRAVTSQDYHDVANTVSSSTVIVPQHQNSSVGAPAVALARTGNPVTFKSLISHPTRNSPYRLPVYSSVRFRARNMKKQQQQQMNLTKTFQQVNSINSTNITDADWINDEEMLFARFVGLRLKKMNSHCRSMARMKIMQVLDSYEEGMIDDDE
uniref:MADF domain-containing protein n=1 Tax=Setaria digitata TaxID=48799 RepID=A0A915PN80_9BILA